MNPQISPLRVIHSQAPIRICDTGGWTDTWFAQFGAIFNLGVSPYAEVQIELLASPAESGRVAIYAENYGDRYVMDRAAGNWGCHPLLEAAIERMRVPPELSLRITVFCEAPAGASTGTSAAVAVALVGALDYLTPGRLSVHEVACTAHAVEVEMLQRQSGIQDQLCSAYGGINYIEMFAYPRASVSQLNVALDTWSELERRLVLIYLGTAHDSSQIHQKVIRELQDAGPDCPQLNDLRRCAARSRDALLAADFAALGRAMCDNTEAQGRLHPDLVGLDALRVIEVARAYGAAGWKVNGAGGEGGSLTILAGPHGHQKRAMIRAIEAERGMRSIPVHLSRHGLRVWETTRA